MNQRRLSVIAGAGTLALLTIAAEAVSAPQAVLVVLSVLLVFILPGYATVCALLPGQELSLGERLLVSVAASLAITTGLAVLLAASPIGLSKGSVAVTLGLGTAAVSLCAWIRTRQLLGGADFRVSNQAIAKREGHNNQRNEDDTRRL